MSRKKNDNYIILHHDMNLIYIQFDVSVKENSNIIIGDLGNEV